MQSDSFSGLDFDDTADADSAEEAVSPHIRVQQLGCFPNMILDCVCLLFEPIRFRICCMLHQLLGKF